MNVRRPLLVLASLLVPLPALAQQAPAAPTAPVDDFDQKVSAVIISGGLTAEQAAARAAKVDPDVRRRKAETAEREAAVLGVQVSKIPRVSVLASYTRLSDIPAISLGPVSIEPILNSWVNRLDVSVPVSDYFLRYPSLTRAAKTGAHAARLNERATALTVSDDARALYYEWVRAKLQVIVAEQAVAQIAGTLQRIQALVDVQRASRADLLRIQAQEAQIRQGLLQAQQVALLRERQLRLAIGAEDDEALAVGEDVRAEPAAPAAGTDVHALTVTAFQRRLELRAIDEALQASADQRRATKAGYYPRLDAVASVNYDNPNARVFPQEDELKMTWAAGVRLTWSLTDIATAGVQVEEQDAQDRQLRADRENLAHGLELQVISAAQAVDLAHASLETTAQAQAAAEESFRVRQELLAADRATAVELIDAQTELTRARVAAIDARIDLRIALARLAHATGEDAK